MQPPQQHSRINLAVLKAEMVRKIGPERSKHYFTHLDRLISLNLSKSEFNKVCKGIVGRENIPLHNQLIRSVLKNTFTAKVPPLANEVDVLKAKRVVEAKEHPGDVYEQNGSHPSTGQPPNPLALSNGDMLPLSLRKARTGTRDRRIGDQHSALGSNGRRQQSVTTLYGDFNVNSENGDFITPNRRSLQQHQGLKLQADNEVQLLGDHPANLSKVSTIGSVSVHSTNKTELSVKKDEGEVSARRLLHPPLGILFCAASAGAARRVVPLANSSKLVSSFNSGDLLDTVTLKEQMNQIAITHGLEGVSMDTAKILNNCIGFYLKGLIRSCHELVVARSGLGLAGHITHKHKAHLNIANGLRPDHSYQMQSSSRPLEVMHERRPRCAISLLDFRTAMELNPQQLGEDWPLLLEKICMCAFEDDI